MALSFKYLGRVLTATNDDWVAVISNPRKARNHWSLMSCILGWEGENKWLYGIFYKAVFQAVLIYGSETLVLMPWNIWTLGTFHHRVDRLITGKQQRQLANRGWFYPPLEDEINEEGLKTINDYNDCHENKSDQYIATRMILELCLAAERSPGAWVTKWW